jgi:predicted component of type VI protein secretion system
MLACGKPGPPGPPPATPAETVETISWSYAPGAIRIGLIADQGLNVFGEGPTGLALCLYQLSDPNKLITLSQAKPGLLTLLACSPDLAGAVSAERLYVQPGQKSDLILDRLEKTRYLAVVAGYQDLRPANSAAVLAIPIETSREYFIFKRYQPEPFEAWLALKPQSVQFFHKSSKDRGRLAQDVKDDPKPGPAPKFPKAGSPTIATPDAQDLKTAAKATPWPKPESDDLGSSFRLP